MPRIWLIKKSCTLWIIKTFFLTNLYYFEVDELGVVFLSGRPMLRLSTAVDQIIEFIKNTKWEADSIHSFSESHTKLQPYVPIKYKELSSYREFTVGMVVKFRTSWFVKNLTSTNNESRLSLCFTTSSEVLGTYPVNAPISARGAYLIF